MTRAESYQRIENVKAYKAKGHTIAETAEVFGLNKDYVKKICRGIAPQVQGRKSDEDVAQFISDRMPEFEYAGNYTGCDGRADIKCVSCGTVINRSMISIRKRHCSCPKCRDDEIRLITQSREKRAEGRKAAKDIIKAKREAERIKKIEARDNRPYKECVVCGTLTQNPKYCCVACSNKANWTTKEHRRRARLKAQMVDKDISVEGLFRRDKGICALCGRRCDLEDYTVREGVFIAGDWYPSVDHIKPISKGGLHSWDNVQLAHRLCNTLKSDKT